MASYETAVDVPLNATDADRDPVEPRIIDQPGHGGVGLTGSTATYYPERGFAGTDSFTWAAFDGDTDSNLAVVTVSVAGPIDPPPVPDGRQISGKQLLMTKVPSGDVWVSWDVAACPSPGYHLVWYDLTAMSPHSIAAEDCLGGPAGSEVVTPPGGLVAAAMVPNDGDAVEGSHGLDSSGQERPSADQACGMAEKRPDGACQ